MIIATHYHIQSIQTVFTIINHDPPRCPSCGRNLVGFGYRKRICREWMTFPSRIQHEDSPIPLPGDILQIRRLFCPDCEQVHHELPIDMVRQ